MAEQASHLISSIRYRLDLLEAVLEYYRNGVPLPPGFVIHQDQHTQDQYTPTSPVPRIFTPPSSHDLGYSEYVIIPSAGRVPVPTPPFMFQTHRDFVSPHSSSVSLDFPPVGNAPPSRNPLRTSPANNQHVDDPLINLTANRPHVDVPLVDLTTPPSSPINFSSRGSPPSRGLDSYLMEALHRMPSIDHPPGASITIPPPTISPPTVLSESSTMMSRQQLVARSRRRFHPYSNPSVPSSFDKPGPFH